jgi:tetratricopeptide (TPR) repeat protein
MSLLMQALKKAERARHNHDAGEELAKPSEAFDQLLALEPQAAAALRDEPTLASDDVPSEPLSLSPLDFTPSAAPSPPPEPAPPGGAPEALAPSAQPDAAGAAPRSARAAPPPRAPQPKARRPAIGMPSARAIRLATLAGAVLLIGAVFGYMYWRAVYGPGSSRNLPMVPMPGQDDAAAPPAALAFAAQPSAAPLPAPVQQPAYSAAPAQAAATPVGAPSPAVAVPVAAPAAAGPAAGAPPPNAEDEVRRIARENQERADRIDRMESMGRMAAPQVVAAAPYPATAAPSTGYPAATAPPPAQAMAAAPDSSAIRVARASTPEQVDPALQGAFTAFNQGDFVTARQQYQAVLQHDAHNRDALLGMAALALHGGQPEQAAAIYVRLLDIDANDSDALAGLAGLRQGDPGQTENRLRRTLARTPDAGPVLFALGNLYARQGRWAEAQQQYFKAYSSAPSNPHYAFNLAVGLDRLGQPRLAANYYQRALALSAAGAVNVNVDRNAVANRLRELGAQ